MKKITIETKEIHSFEPHEWEKVSSSPVIFESLIDGVFLTFAEILSEISDDSSTIFTTPTTERCEFKKGVQVEVSIVARELGDLLLRYSFDSDSKSDVSTQGEIQVTYDVGTINTTTKRTI